MGTQFEYALFAVPYFMPPFAGTALAGSHPPEPDLLDELRIPYPSVLVLFGAPLRFGPASKWVTSSTNGTTQWEILHNEGGELSGVILCGDGKGVPFNMAIYLLSLGYSSDAAKTLIAGELRYGAFSSVATNAASIVSWGSWNEPDLTQILNLAQPVSEIRNEVRRGSFRRRAKSGAALGTHVIDVGQTYARGSGEVDGASTIAPHMRRGHWRRAWVGPRTDWHYEGRWIAPTLVNAAISSEVPDVLYRLPDPPIGPAPEEAVEDLTF